MMIYTSNIFFGSVAEGGRVGTQSDPHVIENKAAGVIVDKRYEDEIKALRDYIGENSFLSGLCIEVSLQEMLSIIPKTRRRIDAYNSLVKYLKDELNITLTIKSKKTKNND